MFQNKSRSVISGSIWQHFPGNVNPCNIDKVHWKRETNPSMREPAGQEQQPGARGALGVGRFFQALWGGQQLDPSGLILLPETPGIQVWVDSSQQGEDTCTLLPAELHPSCTSNVQPCCCHGRGICPSCTGSWAEFNCTAPVPCPGCTTGVLFHSNESWWRNKMESASSVSQNHRMTWVGLES